MTISRRKGHVQIVGAGPGDPDLLTLKALHALQSSDLVLYDDLVTSAILGRVRRDAELVFVGKRKGAPGIGQDEINRRMIAAAKAGRHVVRLKGGDPFIFGRGGEELRSAGSRRHYCLGRARHHRGARLRGRSRPAADVAQGSDAAFHRHREYRGRCRQDRLVGSCRPRHHGRGLYGTDRGIRREERTDRRRTRSAHAGRGAGTRHAARIRAASPARSRNCRPWPRRQARGRR